MALDVGTLGIDEGGDTVWEAGESVKDHIENNKTTSPTQL